jgi:signal transduction histidine kinase
LENHAHLKPETQAKLWLPNIAPRKGLAFSAFAALILVLLMTHICLRQPCLGIIWTPTPDDSGLMVRKSSDSLALLSGSTIVSLSAPHGRPIPLNKAMLVEDPDQFSTYAAYNSFFDQQQRLMALYRQRTVLLTDADGGNTMIQVRAGREVAQIPASFWILNLSAAICFLIGWGVWLYRRAQATSRLLAVTALCYFLSILCLSIYSSRELVLEPVLFRYLSAANHFFTIGWCYSLLLMFAYYPARMGNSNPVAVTYLIALVVWLNQTLQWQQVPIHAYYMTNHIVIYGVAIALGFLQWRQTARQPVERAALRWFILSIWISIGVAGSLFIVPGLTHDYGAIPFWVPALSILMMFICFAFGILRYGLFDLEKWWFTGWVWLASGLLIAGIDIVSVYLLDVGFKAVLPYSVLLLGWIYFPVRQWLWNRLVKPRTYLLEHHLPALIQSLFESQAMHDFIEKWSTVLQQVFNPLRLEIKEEPHASIKTLHNGLALQIPGLDGRHVCHLTGNRQGTRLFGPRDEGLARALLDLCRAVFTITNRTREVQQKGAAQERERIMRDLHDDILPKLITIKQRSPNDAISRLAEAAFQAIRETIYLLRYPSSRPLEEILADWRSELAERLAPFDIGFQWEPPGYPDGYCLTSLQFISCSRILREGVSNILQHAGATKVSVRFDVDDGRLRMAIGDNGKGSPPAILKGMGTSNMRLRAQALKGHIAWHNSDPNDPRNPTGLTVELCFPMGRHGAEYPSTGINTQGGRGEP